MGRFTLAIGFLAISFRTAFGAQEYLYWTDDGSGRIMRCGLDGSHVTDLVSGINQPQGIAIDEVHDKLYWTTRGSGAGTGTIQRSNLDGSDVQTILAGLGAPDGVAISAVAGIAYYTDRSDMNGGSNQRGIHQVNLDGTGQALLLATGNGPNDPSNPLNIELDQGAGKLYWTDDGPDSLSRANLDGTGHQVFLSGPFGTSGLGLDVASDHIFWTNSSTHEIRRANLDGTSNTQILGGLGEASGLALDLTAGKMYWTEFNTGKIRVAALDGSGLQDLVVSAHQPVDLLIGVPEPDTWLLGVVAAASISSVSMRWRRHAARRSSP